METPEVAEGFEVLSVLPSAETWGDDPAAPGSGRREARAGGQRPSVRVQVAPPAFFFHNAVLQL